jgi:hypothetical protein
LAIGLSGISASDIRDVFVEPAAYFPHGPHGSIPGDNAVNVVDTLLR